jgi:hypothetical protein
LSSISRKYGCDSWNCANRVWDANADSNTNSTTDFTYAYNHAESQSNPISHTHHNAQCHYGSNTNHTNPNNK